MRTLRRLTITVAASLLALGSAACSAGSPTASATVPTGSRFEGGLGFGSGNYTGGTTTPSDSGSTATRGGSTFGSGN